MTVNQAYEADIDGYCLVQLPVMDLQRSVHFYTTVLGYVLEHPERPIAEHTFLRTRSGQGPGLHLLQTPEEEFKTSHWSIGGNAVHAIELHSKNIAALHERLRQNGVRVVEEPYYTACGGYLKFLDPDGHHFCVNQGIEYGGAR